MTEEHFLRGKTAVYHTLGCKMNFSETATINKAFQGAGVRNVRKGEQADICVVNTCSVTETADSKGRQAIRRLAKAHPGAFVVVTGCYAQLKPQEVAAIPGVDMVLGAEQKRDLVRHVGDAMEQGMRGQVLVSPMNGIKTFAPSCSRGDRTRYFLKVQDGCNCFCTYCTIPFARGRSRNGSIASLVGEVRTAVAEGGKEIVITGVNIGDFGRSTGETFLNLIQALDEVEGVERYRISSIEPDLLSDEVIAFVAQSKHFMPHFHIPLQSGCDEVLQLMHRRYDRELFARKVERIKQLMPNCFIGVDMIVGTRGETDACFEDSFQFVRALPVTQLHVFSYSERPGTMALKIDHAVCAADKRRRSGRLLELSAQKTRTFYEQHIGVVMPVLLEKARRGKPMNGFTPNYIRVEVSNTPELDNQIVPVRLGAFNGDASALKGEILL